MGLLDVAIFPVNFRYPNLRNLSRMLRVIDLGSLTTVAGNIGRSQQTISHSIKALEDELGVRLFERSSLGTHATQEALVLGRRVRNALRHLAQAQGVTHKDQRSSGNTRGLRIWDFNVSNQHVFVFLALCELREAKRAANQLSLDVSAVRKAIRALEGQLGQVLFEKASRGFLIPTEFAEHLARQTKLALWEIRAGLGELTSLDGAIEGEVVIGALPHAHPTLLPRIISRLREKYPKLKVSLRAGSYDDLERALSCREIDFILGSERGRPKSADNIAHPLFEDRIEILARAGHPLAAMENPELRQYLDCNWVLPPRHVPMRQHFSAFLNSRNFDEPAAAFETGDRETIKGILLETDWLSLSLRCESFQEADHGILTFLPRPHDPAGLLDSPVRLHLTFPAEAVRSPCAQVFFDETVRVSAELHKQLTRSPS